MTDDFERAGTRAGAYGRPSGRVCPPFLRTGRCTLLETGNRYKGVDGWQEGDRLFQESLEQYNVALELQKRKREKSREALLRVLANFEDVQTLQLFWAINKLQSDDNQGVRLYISYPPEAATDDVTSDYNVHKWVIESLLLLLLSTPKEYSRAVKPNIYKEFDGARVLFNLYKSAHDAEGAVLINASNVIAEVQRYGHKQFLWQRTFFNTERMYRYYFVYGQGKCADYFEQAYGLTIQEFAISCVALYMQTRKFPWQALPVILNQLKLRQAALELTLGMVSLPLSDLRAETKRRIDEVAHTSQSTLAYFPSSLRHYPIVLSSAQNGRMIAPLPQLIIFRATSGLYYDLKSGPQYLLEEANERFEQYGKRIIEARCPEFSVLREQEFGPKKSRYRTPDLLLKHEGTVKVVFECKATKLTFAAQFADNQYAEAPAAFSQIAKGMSQLWKFFSRARRGLYTAEAVDPDAYGVVLTMESWFQIDTSQISELRQQAEALVADEPDMRPEDMREVLFCSIESLDDVLAASTEAEFLETLSKSRKPEHRGWQLQHIRKPSWEPALPRKPYPFNIRDVLPLWDQFIR